MGNRSAPVTMGRRPTSGPWHRGDRLRLALLLLLTSAGLTASWWMTAGSGDGSTQLMWMEGAIAAAVVAAVASTLWLTAGHRAISRRRRRLASRAAAIAVRVGSLPVTTRRAVGAVCSAERMTRYHRAGCPLVQGKPVVWSSAEESRRGGLHPCGICEP